MFCVQPRILLDEIRLKTYYFLVHYTLLKRDRALEGVHTFSCNISRLDLNFSVGFDLILLIQKFLSKKKKSFLYDIATQMYTRKWSEYLGPYN